jgi:predicted amidohydrolase YtcJ
VGSEPIKVDHLREFAGDDRLWIRGCKTFIDGTLGSRTARMLAPYEDDPGNRGMFVELAAAGRLHEWIRAVAAAGRSPSMHAIGDEAVRCALDAIDALDNQQRARVQPRIEHAQHVDPADVARCAERIVSMQPLHKADDARSMRVRIGEQRARWAFAFRSLRDAGALLAFGSDWPVVSCDPLAGIRAAVTGLTLDGDAFNVCENITVEAALLAYTRDAARCIGLADAGMLREGMLGDCVLLDGDPFTADWRMRPPRVIMTIVGGTVVFDATNPNTPDIAHAR